MCQRNRPDVVPYAPLINGQDLITARPRLQGTYSTRTVRLFALARKVAVLGAEGYEGTKVRKYESTFLQSVGVFSLNFVLSF